MENMYVKYTCMYKIQSDERSSDSVFRYLNGGYLSGKHSFLRVVEINWLNFLLKYKLF